MIQTFNIHIKDKEHKKYLLSYIYKYRHFENLYLLFIKSSDNNDFKFISNYRIMRSVLNNTIGGKFEENIKNINYIREKYKNNVFLIQLIEKSKELKIHNIVSIIKRIKTSYKTFFTNIKKNVKTSIPKAKKLNLLTNYSIPLDQIAWSLKRKNKLGLNFNDKMIYLNIKHDIFNDICGDINRTKTSSSLSSLRLYFRL
jgi:hypothetical protein